MVTIDVDVLVTNVLLAKTELGWSPHFAQVGAFIAHASAWKCGLSAGPPERWRVQQLISA